MRRHALQRPPSPTRRRALASNRDLEATGRSWAKLVRVGNCADPGRQDASLLDGPTAPALADRIGSFVLGWKANRRALGTARRPLFQGTWRASQRHQRYPQAAPCPSRPDLAHVPQGVAFWPALTTGQIRCITVLASLGLARRRLRSGPRQGVHRQTTREGCLLDGFVY